MRQTSWLEVDNGMDNTIFGLNCRDDFSGSQDLVGPTCEMDVTNRFVTVMNAFDCDPSAIKRVRHTLGRRLMAAPNALSFPEGLHQ